MAVAHQFLVAKQQLYASLAPDERAFADRLLQLDPQYRYDRSGLPKLDPIPAAGLASAVAAALRCQAGSDPSSWGLALASQSLSRRVCS